MNALLEAIKAEVNPDGTAGLRVIPLNYVLGDRLPSAIVPTTTKAIAPFTRRTGKPLLPRGASGCYTCKRTKRELEAMGHVRGCWFDYYA